MSDEGYCEVDFSDYSADADPVEFSHRKMVKARKSHACTECGEPIAVREEYERTSYKFEGEMCVERRCLPCGEAAAEFDHRVYSTLWQSFRDEWDQGAHISACIARLTTARAKEHMRRQWLKWKGLPTDPKA